MMLSSLAIAVMLVTQEPPQVRPAVAPEREFLRFEEGFRPTRGGQYIQLLISAPIGADEWRRYGRMLQLSDAQWHALIEPYERYRRADWAFRMDKAQPLWERSSEIAVLRNVTTNSASAEKLRALYVEAHELERFIDRYEDALFAETAQMLGSEQASLVDVVRMRRARQRSQECRSPYRAFNFDIDDELLSMRLAETDITPKDPAVFEGLLAAWRTGATSLAAKLDQQQRKTVNDRLASPAIISEMVARDGITPEAIAFAERDRELGKPAAQAGRAVFDFNARYVELISAELPAQAAETLRDRFESQAYQGIMPDPADMRVVFRALDKLQLTDEQKLLLSDIRTDCQSVNDASLLRLKSIYLAWNDKVCVIRGYAHEEFADYSAEMRRIEDARIAKCRTTLEAIQSVLSPEQFNDIREACDTWRSWAEGFGKRQADAMQRYAGWPGPYD